MNIALTGSSGLIGSHILSDLKNMGHNVLCISSSESCPEENIFLYEELQSSTIKFKAQFLIHLATVNSSLQESEIPLEIDLIKKAINSMEILNCKNFIFFSTIKVYGDNSFGFNIFDEECPKNPSCFYGKAKSQCEEILMNSAIEINFNYLILRLPPILINHPKSNLGKLFKLVERGFPIPSFRVGDSNRRSFLSYHLLVCFMKEVFIIKELSSNNILNLSDKDPISTNDLLKRFGKTINKNPRIIYLPHLLFKAMIRVNRLQFALCKLFGNFHISTSKVRDVYKLQNIFDK